MTGGFCEQLGGAGGYSSHGREFGKGAEHLFGSMNVHEERVAGGHPALDEIIPTPVVYLVKFAESLYLPGGDMLLVLHAPCLLIVPAGDAFFQVHDLRLEGQ